MRRFQVLKSHRRPQSMVFQANAGLPSFSVASASDSLGFVTLASPKNPEVDIIFVHAIDGGSFSSWAKNGDPKYYWPKEWLPNEVGLGRARIHTYGYNVNPKRNTNAHVDFSRQLLCDLICSPLWFGKVKTPNSCLDHSYQANEPPVAYHICCTFNWRPYSKECRSFPARNGSRVSCSVANVTLRFLLWQK